MEIFGNKIKLVLDVSENICAAIIMALCKIVTMYFSTILTLYYTL